MTIGTDPKRTSTPDIPARYPLPPNISPTPWRPWEGGPSHLVVAADETNVAILSDLARDQALSADPDIREANGRLMAEAPNLFACCGELIGILAAEGLLSEATDRVQHVMTRAGRRAGV